MPEEINKNLFILRIRELIAESLGVEPKWVDDDESLSNMGFDSLDIAELSIKIEMKFGLYDADPHYWLEKHDTVNTTATKLEKLYHDHRRKYPLGDS